MNELVSVFGGVVGFIIALGFLLNTSYGKGFSKWIKFRKTVRFIRSYQRKIEKKLPTFELLPKADFSPYEVGLLPSAAEYKIEYPCSSETFQHCDGIHFFGVDASHNLIDICINEVQDNVATTWIFLKFNNGEEYRFPGDFDTRVSYIDREQSFYSSALQIKCLNPLRKWRISFNGLLQKSNSTSDKEGKDEELIHVRFSFIWLALSVGQELDVDFNPKELTRALLDASKNVEPEDLRCFQDMQNRYEQWGQLMGTCKIKGQDEQELYLWSCKTRILDNPMWSKETTFAKFYMYFKEGFPLKLEVLDIKDFLSSYTQAYTLLGLGGIEMISECDFKLPILQNKPTKINFSCETSGKIQNFAIEFTKQKEVIMVGPNLELSVTLQPFKVTTDDGYNGYGILHFGKSAESVIESFVNSPPLLLKETNLQEHTDKFVVLLTDNDSKNSLVSGGKGCSLGLLTSLAKERPLEFDVPKGFIISTAAFENHIKTNGSLSYAIKRLVDISGEKIEGDLKTECIRCVEEFQSVKMSDVLKEDIKNALFLQHTSIEDKRFSIRSSACGEDSEDLSAAGQMLTVLGARGLNNIVDAVVKCWSSKFGFEAVQYARQNGQPIRSPMAVVVQEMVPSEVSGVMFTVDPVTGDPSHPYITANFGLGETVVSALAEPDTIILTRNKVNSVSLKEVVIGSKKSQIHMKAGEGTEEKSLDSELSRSCLNEEWAVKIGSIGILVENCFCSPRDIEWAVYKNKLYLLQARPVTTLHTETDFELIHDQDTPLRSDNEFWTKANVGEVYLSATSPLGISIICAAHDVLSHRGQILREKMPLKNYCPFYFHMLPITHRHVTLSIIDILYNQNEKEISSRQKAFEVALFGRSIGTAEMHKAGVKKYGYTSKTKQWALTVFIFMFSFKIKSIIKETGEKLRQYKFPIETFVSVEKTFQGLLDQFPFYNSIVEAHGIVTYMASMYNLIVLTVLGRGKDEWDSQLYCDFATVLSSCSGVESANVPESLRDLAQSIVKNLGTSFSSLDVNNACKILSNDEGESGILFKEFLRRHGHRCIKEFDMHSKSWAMNPENLVSILQSMVIKLVDGFRQTCHQLGKLMVQEGMLPSCDLIFFLDLEEIKEIIDTRKPGLISKAVRRSRLQPQLEKLQFPEIMKGIPKPIVKEENVSKYSKSFTLKGIPVCQGKVKAVARVVTCIGEAPTIKNGDVLITQSTDIGWTPYFPLLSGVVTVLGGLISHGAVVAREYGLPCVVGVQEAMSAFKSGDVIILDGTNGTITKIESSEKN
ncbi:hypothetical protein JTE90_025340 [Oedothorax gibbosus]|uniref:Phosphoenolpyruvate synthase n=1 Tax=Oedothorax gibbosus TaxID=931172 RepID=A0AAV6V794_9ARAC|nr:hypothetical protein JTE90_025340 [Oedothorax gibbosus]